MHGIDEVKNEPSHGHHAHPGCPGSAMRDMTSGPADSDTKSIETKRFMKI